MIQDTTEVSFEAHAGRLRPDSGLGWLSNNRHHGYCLHSALVVDARVGWALGFAEAQVWARRLGPEVRLTTVADREADIYSLFARRPEGTDAVVRACRDRRIGEAPGRLYAFLGQQPVRGRRDPRTLRLWAVEVVEINPPDDIEPNCWRLLTTRPIETFAQARQIGRWYRQRWHLKQVFRLLKRDGLDLEASELECGNASQRLGVLALGAALDVLRLLMAERSNEDAGLNERSAPIEAVFDEREQACLAALSPGLEPRTVKQQNPHPKGTLAWAAWTIARLGGWSGYRSQRPAGPATYHRGLRRFYAINDGWHLALRDLYKP